MADAEVGTHAQALQRSCELLKSARFTDRMMALLSVSARLSDSIFQQDTPAALEFRRKIFTALTPEFFRVGLRKDAYRWYNLPFPESDWDSLHLVVVQSFAVFSHDAALQPFLFPAMHIVADTLQDELACMVDSGSFEVVAGLTQSLWNLLRSAAGNAAEMDAEGILTAAAKALSILFPLYHRQQLALKRGSPDGCTNAATDGVTQRWRVDDCLSHVLSIVYWLLYSGFASGAIDAVAVQRLMASVLGPLLWLLQAPPLELTLQAAATLCLLLEIAGDIPKGLAVDFSQLCEGTPLWQVARNSILQLLAARDDSPNKLPTGFQCKCNAYMITLAFVRCFGFGWLKYAEGNAASTTFLHALSRLLSVDIRLTLDFSETLTMPTATQPASLHSLPVTKPQNPIQRLAFLRSSRSTLIALITLQTDVFGMIIQVFADILETIPSENAVTASNSSSIESVVQVHQVLLSIVEALAGHLHALQVSDMFPLFAGASSMPRLEGTVVQSLATICAQTSEDDVPLSPEQQQCMSVFVFLMEAEIALECASAIASYCSQLADSTDTQPATTAVMREIALALPITVCLHDGIKGASIDLQKLTDASVFSNAERGTRLDQLAISSLSSVPAAHIVPVVWNTLLHGPPVHGEAANEEGDDETALLHGIAVDHVAPFLISWTDTVLRKTSLSIMNLRAQEKQDAHAAEREALISAVSAAATLLGPCLQEVRKTTMLASTLKPLCPALQAFCARMLSPANTSMFGEQATEWVAALGDILASSRHP